MSKLSNLSIFDTSSETLIFPQYGPVRLNLLRVMVRFLHYIKLEMRLPAVRTRKYLWTFAVVMAAAGLGPRPVAAGGLDGSVVVATPKGVCPGGVITITQTVTNTGVVDLFVTPDRDLSVDPMFAANWAQGPPLTPPVTLTPGKSATFTWLYSTSSFVGFIRFSATTYGNDGGATSFPPAVGKSNTVAVIGSADLAPDAGLLSVSALVMPTTVSVGELFDVTMTVANNAVVDVNNVLPEIAVGPGGSLVSLWASPFTFVPLAPGMTQTYTWTYSASGSGLAVFTVTATGNICGVPVVASAGAKADLVLPPLPPPVVEKPADLAIASLTLNPGPNVTSGDTVTVTLTLSNSGGVDAEVTSIIENVSAPGIFELSSLLPSTPFMVPAGSIKTVTWTYLAVSCGTASGNVTVMGMEPVGNTLGPVVAGLTIVVTGPGTPTNLTLMASQQQAQVGNVVDLTVEVSDDCIPPNPVVGARVTLVVQAGGGLISPISGVTDSAGRMTAQLSLGAEPGPNVVTATVASALAVGGATLNGTVTVEGTPLSAPRPSLSKNFFNPGKGEDVQVRVLLPKAARPTVTIRIYNMAGELIRAVNNVPVQAGLAQWPWDGRAEDGNIVGNGVYFIQIESGKHVEIKRVIVLKR